MKYALVTGGSRGIGRAICTALAAKGYPVIINYASNEAAANETKALIEANGGTAELLSFDVSDEVSVDKALEGWADNHPDDYVGILVNNAGIRQDAMMIFMQNAQWRNVLDTSVNGFFFVTRRVLKDMLIKRDGRIVNIVSLSGLKGMPGQTNYSAAKAAVIGATKALAQEVAPRSNSQCHCSGVYHDGHDQRLGRSGAEEEYSAGTVRKARGSRFARQLSHLRRGRLHHRRSDFNQRRSVLTLIQLPVRYICK